MTELTIPTVQQALMRLSKAMATTQGELSIQTVKAVEADHAYRLARLTAMARSQEKTQGMREAEAELASLDQRREAKLAEGRKDATLERLRSVRSEMQAWQALAYVLRSEMELARG
jgi:hypothetical protein